MKYFTIAILVGLLALSCSDPKVLTKSSAEDIINACMEKEKYFQTIPVDIGKDIVLTKRGREFTEALAEKGLVNFSKVKGKYNITQNNVELTEKGKNLVLSEVKKVYQYGGGEYTETRFKSCEYRVSEIIEIQEIPAFNGAKVKVKFEKTNKTDISFLDPNETEFWTTDIGLKKTTDGWKYCD
mgnify:CR=1 FL=1